MMIETACAFTGHRPKSFPWKYDETAPDCVLLKEILAEQIKILADGGVTNFFIRHGPGSRPLEQSDCPQSPKEKSCAEVPLCPALQGTGEQVDGISAGTLSLNFGAGQ